EDKVVEVIETSATSTDPADCEALATRSFLEQTQFSEGKEAVKSCEEDAEETEGDPESVEVTEVEVDGSSATADSEFVGGDFDGQVLSVALVEEDGEWKMDEITGFAKLDQEQLASSLEESFQSGENGLDAEVASCMGDALRELSEPEVEEVVFGGSSEPIVELLESCE
ncbi:MAG TPA: hypothetical protein VGV69_03845, partial [Solirubrobacterales bacterium]|nr:hypothetical protein [Solirubrobacterales bacterium]